MKRKPNPELLDEDNPELQAEWFSRSKPAAHVLPSLVGRELAAELLKPKRGRPALDEPKRHVNIRLDADVLDAFKSRGPGWQTRMNLALREWLTTHAP
jgi:uncharacterized protein (DUF4415 family)